MSDKLKERLETLPEEIQKQEFKILGFSNAINTFNKEIEEMEVNTMAKIAREKVIDDEGIEKKKYPNEAARLGEFKKQLNRKDYNEAVKNINENKNNLEREKINLKYLKNTLTATKYLVKLYVMEE